MEARKFPRRQIEELATRWKFAGLKTLIVEGAFDRRFLMILQQEGHVDVATKAVDVLTSDDVEMEPSRLHAIGLSSTSAKHRVVGFCRQVESHKLTPGFRGVVDRDLDIAMKVDHSTESLLYTDMGCLECYVWNEAVLRSIIVQFRCEETISTKSELRDLYTSVTSACADLAAFRVVVASRPDLRLNIHRSEKSLLFTRKRLAIDLEKYSSQGVTVKNTSAEVIALTHQTRKEIEGLEQMMILNGHDLVWLLTSALREFSALPRRGIEEQGIENSLVAFGVRENNFSQQPLFRRIAEWAQ